MNGIFLSKYLLFCLLAIILSILSWNIWIWHLIFFKFAMFYSKFTFNCQHLIFVIPVTLYLPHFIKKYKDLASSSNNFNSFKIIFLMSLFLLLVIRSYLLSITTTHLYNPLSLINQRERDFENFCWFIFLSKWKYCKKEI